MKLRHLMMAAALLALPAGTALAQGYAHEPPGDYMRAPPRDWDHRDSWHRMSERERQAYWAQHRRESWRCEHGDRGACGWLHDHGNG